MSHYHDVKGKWVDGRHAMELGVEVAQNTVKLCIHATCIIYEGL